MKTNALFNLEKKVAIVTGGARGIGKFITSGMAEAGADVVIASRNFDNCVETAKEMEQLGVKALPVRCDLSKFDDIQTLLEKTMEAFGRVDILVNNAGLTWGAPTLSYPLEKWQKVLDVNLTALFLLSRDTAKIMAEQKEGKIINISSVLGFRGSTEEMSPALAYNASKGAINAFTIDLAVKLARYNINVNAVAPGYFDTELVKYTKQDQNLYNKFIDKIPIGRFGGEDDIKGAVVFLASEAARYLTGHILCVDGGYMTK